MKLGRLWERYAVPLREQSPEELANRPVTRARVMVSALGVLVLLDLNDWLIARIAPDTPARLDPAIFPWAGEVQAAWPAMKEEVECYLRRRSIPEMAEVNGLVPGSEEARASVPTDVGAWRGLVLQWFGEDIDENATHFPRTVEALRQVKVTSFGFTSLDPRAHIPAHRGPNRGAVRYQLPIIVPGPPGACRIRVEDEIIPWREGESVVFDLHVDHEVWNDTDEVRVLMMVEARLPLPFPASVTNAVAQRAYRHFPTFHGLTDRVRALALDQSREVTR
jgi:ornithine lipid ester-linked acyl 2-hydroxylase